MYTISMISTKGGVGKTTTTANLGALAADIGFRVLLVDADPQGSLSKYYPLSHFAPHNHGLVEMMLGINGMDADPLDGIISKTIMPNLDIVVSNDPTSKLQVLLPQRPDARILLKNALAYPYILENYDLAIIDTQGAGGLLQDAAAYAGNIILSPVAPDVLSIREFQHGTLEMIARLERGRSMGLIPGRVKGFFSRMDRSKNAKEVSELLKSSLLAFEDKLDFLATIIPYAKAYNEAATAKIPVHIHEIVHAGKQVSASDTMHNLFWELIPNLHGLRGKMFADGLYNSVKQ